MFDIFEVETNHDLYRLIEASLDVRVPNVAVCEGHQSPFDFVSDSYFEKVDNVLVIGPRTGGKTLNSAVLEFIESAKKTGCESCHLGSILSQSRRAYKYVSKWGNKYRSDLDITTLTKEKTIFGNGSEIEIVAGTANGVNSPHPHKATIDEFELLSWDIFQEAISMPKSSNNIKSALRLETTRKYPSGNAQRMIDDAENLGFKVYKWCVFEIMQRCTKSNCKSCEKYVSYDREGKEHRWIDVCGGKARKSNGYLPISDVLKKFSFWETFDAQWLCNRPGRSDAVFPEFNFDVHVVEPFFPMITAPASMQRFGRGWDFGLNDPTAVLFFFVMDDESIVVFDEIVESGILIDDMAEKVRAKSDPIAATSEWLDWGDPSGNARTGVDGNSYISKLAEHEIYICSQAAGVMDGISEISQRLRRHSLTGKPSLYITRNCKKTIAALENAQWDRVESTTSNYSREKYRHDEYSHPLDALRYYVFGTSQGKMEIF